MSHDSPVNTMPTHNAGALSPRPGVTVAFDVTSLERTASFYGEHLGFKVVRRERVGLPFETAVLQSDRFPGVALFARKTFQRPVSGSVVGSVTQVGLYDAQLSERAAALEGKVVWIAPPPKAGEPFQRLSFFDPDGYVIELFA